MLDRRAVPTEFDVLPAIPLPDGTETLVWVTNIFIASNLSETRNSLTPYPATTITYNFNLRCKIAKTWLAGLATASNRWMLPYFPYFSYGTITSGRLTFDSSVHFPYYKYLLIYRFGNLKYHAITTATNTSADVVVTGNIDLPDGRVAVAPCFEAILGKAIKYTYQGDNADGSTVSLTFRMTGESERVMNYHVDNFDFVSAVQRPISVDAERRQLTYAPAPAPAHTYSPNAYKENQVPKPSVEYLFDVRRDVADYYFRGAIMKRLGALTADNYLVADKLHRLQDDMIKIVYNAQTAKAMVTLREVAA